jgi:diguanylate cyclase (GGDEF)-like protein
MRLKKLFLLTTLLLLSLVTAMLLRTSLQEFNIYNSAKAGLQVMQLTRLTMTIAEKASLERGPSSALLSSDPNSAAPLRQILRKSREASDNAFADAAAALREQGVRELQGFQETRETQGAQRAPGASGSALQIAATTLSRARDLLLNARREIDRVATLPNKDRDRVAVNTATRDMVTAIDTILEAVAVLSGHAGRIYPDLVDALVASQMAAELHEQASRLGGQLTFALTQQVPLDANESRNIQIHQGRIEQLLNLIWLHMFVGNMDARQSAELAQVRLRFVEVGLPLVRTLSEVGADGRPYGMDADRFSALYAPEMAPIVNLRDVMFTMANEGGKAAYEKTFRSMLLQLAIGIAVLLIEIAVFLFIRRRVLKPLISTNAALVDLARGQLDVDTPASNRHDEIGDMINAVATLKHSSLEKRALEQERERFIEDLKEASSVDYLTGLINRRAFSERATAQLATAVRHQWQVTLIALDIDHFKSINDRYGHAQGDAVLVEVARRIKRTIRVPDVAARFGGEEFIVYAGECDSEAGFALAERIRTSVATAIFFFNDKPFSVTLSAGVITVPATEITDFSPVILQADNALYAAKNEGRNRTVVAQVTQAKPANPTGPTNPA